MKWQRKLRGSKPCRSQPAFSSLMVIATVCSAMTARSCRRSRDVPWGIRLAGTVPDLVGKRGATLRGVRMSESSGANQQRERETGKAEQEQKRGDDAPSQNRIPSQILPRKERPPSPSYTLCSHEIPRAERLQEERWCNGAHGARFSASNPRSTWHFESKRQSSDSGSVSPGR